MSIQNYLLSNSCERQLSLKIRTPVKMNKKGNPFGEIYKTQSIVLMVNKSYTEAVNEQRVAENSEANFSAKKTWGNKITESLIEHEGKMYVQGIFVKYNSEATYDHNGAPIDKAEFEQFLPASKSTNKSQDLETPIQVRKISIENILSFEEM